MSICDIQTPTHEMQSHTQNNAQQSVHRTVLNVGVKLAWFSKFCAIIIK